MGDLLWCLGTATECADGADLAQIKALLASVDPDLLMELLKEIKNQKS